MCEPESPTRFGGCRELREFPCRYGNVLRGETYFVFLQHHLAPESLSCMPWQRANTGPNGFVLRDPLDCLPTEVVATILTFCVDAPNAMHLNYQLAPSSKTDPQVLTHVCRGWRQLAHSTPSLWTHLVLTSIHETKSAYYPLIQQWLQRSKRRTVALEMTTHSSRTSRSLSEPPPIHVY